jgi:carbon monoxide dehydrogenase subunit G
MELVGDILIAAPRPKVWAGLNDPEVLVRCIPGCEAMEATSPTERTARVAVKVGPVRARFAGHVRMEEVRADEGCVLRFEGSGGAAGMAKGHAKVDLADEAGGTRLRYTTQASVGGKLGQVGGRMIDAAAKQMADQFFAAFEAQMTGVPAGAAAPAAAAAEAGAAPQAAAAPAAVQAPTAAVAPPAPAAPGVAPAVPAATAPAPSPAVYLPPPPSPAPRAPAGEGVRILWFVLGSLSTAFGMWVATRLIP